jgi:hypothetical protein
MKRQTCFPFWKVPGHGDRASAKFIATGLRRRGELISDVPKIKNLEATAAELAATYK